ncbi:putative nicotinate-nucleotide pyrophosphorylase [carboxylating] [subsurface metagenome]
MLNKLIDDLLSLALIEDIGDGDHTSLSCILPDAKGKVQLLVKEESVIAGIEIAEIIFKKLDDKLVFEKKISDGTKVFNNDIAFSVYGKIHTILQAERLVLNIMQRMSGIATQTRQYVEKLAGLKTKVLDTRKTTPGMRLLDKAAVKYGGGENHRMGLFDMILIKDNHIDFAGGIDKAILNTRGYLEKKGMKLKIEIEARSVDDVKQILEVGGIDFIMLDNFSVHDTRKAVELIGDKYKTESSGGITLQNIRDYAECGVDYISIGALTHQIGSIDLSLKAIDF